jgi:hypothetical protein
MDESLRMACWYGCAEVVAMLLADARVKPRRVRTLLVDSATNADIRRMVMADTRVVVPPLMETLASSPGATWVVVACTMETITPQHIAAAQRFPVALKALVDGARWQRRRGWLRAAGNTAPTPCPRRPKTRLAKRRRLKAE